jgi:hypothetical protein
MAGYFSFVLSNVEGVVQVIQDNLEGLDYMLFEHFNDVDCVMRGDHYHVCVKGPLYTQGGVQIQFPSK